MGRKKRKAFQHVNPHAAGIDIGSTSHFVALSPDRSSDNVQEFQHFTSDLYRLADWLIQHNVTTVAMESTGVYWLPLYEILEDKGLEVILVNARHISNVPGRKTDVLDCQWIQQLHSFGLLNGGFQPDKDISPIRSLTRHRANWVTCAAKHIQHMQKALRLMNLNLDRVVTDITGATGTRIIQAIIQGERNPFALAKLRDKRCKKSAEEIAQALDGHYRIEQIFILKQAYDLFCYYKLQIDSCDATLKQHFEALDAKIDVKAHPLKKRTNTTKENSRHISCFNLREELYRLSGTDLTRVDGINSYTALKVISEIGTDMTKWETDKRLCSWLCLSPGSKISGGKVLSSRTRKSTNRAAAALRMSAQALSNSKSSLGAYYRRKRYHLGAAKAITATAHKLARIIYALLKTGGEYTDIGEEAYEQQYNQRSIQNLKRKATKLGYVLVDQDTGALAGLAI